ncbi:isoprenylcysteine carboxylmethyltransferase family protein [Maritimibacter sp. HL-12]|uniref:methyltransferase family protein n=1 Tax=Maritimibacter sp. HL-12 TaxID=1162418 RepID=UPI000A0F15D5|nr:isoprenylcysteine carboxylmethyltransferase family protein [Maritimibacter sp. HL-12]SMH52988.1 Protein-S-isoprenylcysteine O-methyltransferase Ste14 [Maritimibacter sp. HL-12]
MREGVRVFKWIDIPPAWLAASLGVTWAIDRLFPWLATGLDWLEWLGAALVLAGLGAMALGAFELVRHHTTFIPRRMPTAFVQQGIYQLSRNPIYLGDALVLAGAALWWDVLPALILVPAFGAIIERRFILGEEAGLVARFGAEAEAWFARVRRWI